MRTIKQIWIAITVLLLSACARGESDSQNPVDELVSYDTLKVNLQGRIASMIRHNQQFYCMVESDNPFSSQSFKHFYVLSSSGNIQHRIDVPEEMNSTYYDLHVRHDSIMVKTYMGGETFYLSPNDMQWIKIEEVDDVVYEDERFYVNFLDFGEWGSTAWFRDRKTGLEYAVSTTTPTINVIDGTYFLSNSQAVYKIADPTQLPECAPSDYYQKVALNGEHYRSTSDQGVEILYRDTSYWVDSKIHIATSFVSNDSLYVIYVDEAGTSIGVIEDEHIVKHEDILDNVSVSRRHYEYRSGLPSSSSRVFNLYSSGFNLNGFLEIDDGAINVLRLENLYELPIVGSEKAHESFTQLVHFQLDNIDDLSLANISNRLEDLEGIDVTPNHRMYIGTDMYPQADEFEIGTPKVFKVIEDSTVTMLVDYYYSRSDDIVRVSMYEWKETNEYNYGISRTKGDSLLITVFNEKFNWLDKVMSEKLGAPTKRSSNGRYREIIWSTNQGVTAILRNVDFSERRRITLRMYAE
ncbi:hypothetical protein [Sanyastnella coralliicola]|uniref:hypothetical protein n=1 Tax=Sanyastnella coralliicola TaxID=3069118 RepID=UPI0027B9FC68|nr:hypothetical protein [Longitalea sp. SCSIO 12813]